MTPEEAALARLRAAGRTPEELRTWLRREVADAPPAPRGGPWRVLAVLAVAVALFVLAALAGLLGGPGWWR